VGCDVHDCGTEEQAAVQSVVSMWLRKRCDEKSSRVFRGPMVKRDDERSFGDHVNWERS
jgi:hypothetical protein